MDDVSSEAAEGGVASNDEQDIVEKTPDYKTQKTEIHTSLQQRLKQGDTW